MKTENRFYSFVLLIIIVLLGYLAYKTIYPFLSAIMWAIVLSLIFYPVYAYILRFVKYRSIASVTTLLIIILLLIGPFSYFAYALSQELINLVKNFQDQNGKGHVLQSLLAHPLVNSFVQKVLPWFKISEKELYNTISTSLMNFAKQSTGLIRAGFGNILAGGINFVIMLFSIFFFLEDGPAFIEKLQNFMPFSRRQRAKLLKQTKDIIVSTIYGGIVVGMTQGLIGGITFAIIGIHSPVFWGLAMFVTSFLPIVGSFIIWGPTVIYLFFEGMYLKATILLTVGVLAIGTVDNILRPLIVGGKMKMPTIVIFFAILGGIQGFGFIGFVLGPLVLALFVSVFEIFRYSEEERFKAGERETSQEKTDAGE